MCFFVVINASVRYAALSRNTILIALLKRTDLPNCSIHTECTMDPITKDASHFLSAILILCAGCGGSATPSDETAASSDTGSNTVSDSAANTTTAQADSGGHAGSTQTEKTKPGRGEVWVDEKGQKWFGDVPMDAFFDQPYTVASNATPVGGDATTAAVVTNNAATGTPPPDMPQTPVTTGSTDAATP